MNTRRLGTPSRVALATCARYPRLTADDALLLDRLRERNIAAVPAIWDDSRIAWGEFDAIVIRSCWDYHLRLSEFLAWIENVERTGVALWNPPPVLRWNVSKTYLRDLGARGVAAVPTHWVAARSEAQLAAVMALHGWNDVVVKPAVSASAHRTRRLRDAVLVSIVVGRGRRARTALSARARIRR